MSHLQWTVTTVGPVKLIIIDFDCIYATKLGCSPGTNGIMFRDAWLVSHYDRQNGEKLIATKLKLNFKTEFKRNYFENGQQY